MLSCYRLSLGRDANPNQLNDMSQAWADLAMLKQPRWQAQKIDQKISIDLDQQMSPHACMHGDMTKHYTT
jgi:hypothetical protein